MKKVLSLLLVLAMILPVLAAPEDQPVIAPAPTVDQPVIAPAPVDPEAPTEPEVPAEPEVPVEPEPVPEPKMEDYAPVAQYTLTADTAVDLGTGNLLLLNNTHQVDTVWAPSDLVSFSGRRVLKPTMELRQETKAAYEAMSKAMDKAGLTLYICSGYRTYDYQTNLFTKRYNAQLKNGLSVQEAFAATNLYTAYPGTSEHETGMAIDLAKDVNAVLNDYFGTTPVGKWLYQHCDEYGFILRYTKEKQAITQIAYEPWHFRYVGLPHSKIITEAGLAFEEYLEQLQGGKEFTYPGEGGKWIIRYTTDRAAIDRMAGVQSYSYDNCGGWVVTCWKEDPGYFVTGHWSQASFDALLAGRDYEGPWVVIPDKAIPLAGFRYLFELLPGLQQPLWGDNEYLTRQSAAAALGGILGRQSGSVENYIDHDLIAPWARDAVYNLSAAGILRGTTDGRFNPNAKLTWGEAAAMLARLQQHLKK